MLHSHGNKSQSWTHIQISDSDTWICRRMIDSYDIDDVALYFIFINLSQVCEEKCHASEVSSDL